MGSDDSAGVNTDGIAALIADAERRLGVPALRHVIRQPFSWPPSAMVDDAAAHAVDDGRSDGECLLQWLEAAAGRGQGRALVFAARMLREGIGVAIDLPGARTLLERAQAYRFPDAAFTLAGMLERGEGGPVDTVRALACYQQSGDLARGRLAIVQVREALLASGAHAAFELRAAAESFRVAAARGALAAGEHCAATTEGLRLLHQRGLADETALALAALESCFSGNVAAAAHQESTLIEALGRSAANGAHHHWRLLGRLLTLGLGTPTTMAIDEAYRRGAATGDGSAAVLLGLQAAARGDFSAARDAWGQRTIDIAGSDRCWGFAEDGMIAWRPAGCLTYRLIDLLPASVAAPVVFELAPTIVAAYEGGEYPEGQAETSDSTLLALLQSGPVPVALFCAECDQRWQGDPARPRIVHRERGPDSACCPNGHELLIGKRIIYD